MLMLFKEFLIINIGFNNVLVVTMVVTRLATFESKLAWFDWNLVAPVF
jgi:hypothetical protein